MKHRNDMKVAVAYPHPGSVPNHFMRSMLFVWHLDAMGAKLPSGDRIGGRRRIVDGGALLAMTSGAVVSRTRNQLVRDFLALECDWMWMIDADMTFDADIVEALIAAAHPEKRPIVGGLCFSYTADKARKFYPTLYAYIPGETLRLRRLTTYPDNTLLPVAATGAACLLVHRSVLEKMQEKYPPPRPWFDETPFYQLDANGDPILSTGDEYSEDITFCLRAQACGFPVFVHTGIKLGHVKEFIADESAFIAESEALRQAVVPALPTYVVIASRNRPEMLANLLNQLDGQATKVFVLDNGYEEPPANSDALEVVPAHGWGLHRMWNHGLDLAEKAAEGAPFNVVVMNDDVAVPNEFLARLEAGLRQDDANWVSYPHDPQVKLENGQTFQVSNPSYAGQTMTGWAFMLRGEAGLRLDERFQFWYGDSDLERTVRKAGKRVVMVGGCEAQHLDPLTSSKSPEMLAVIREDEARFAEKWRIDAASLFMAKNPEFGAEVTV